MKNDPKLTSAKVVVSYHADDGYRSEMTLGDLRPGKSDPKQVLLGAHRETARLLSLFGFEAEARQIANEAHAAVASAFPDRPAYENPDFEHVCNLWVEPETACYIVDRCDHPLSELRAAYVKKGGAK